MSDEHLVVNCDTGAASFVPLTESELIARDGLVTKSLTEATTRAATQSNERTIRQQAEAALAVNTAYIALVAPTNAQNVAQVKALTRQMNGLIRIICNRLDTIDP